MAGRQLSIEAWLNALGLNEYKTIFSKFSRVEELLLFSEADIRDQGVKNSAHRARIVTSLVMLREKMQRKGGGVSRTKTPPGVSPIHSNSASPPSFVNHPDYASLQVPPYQPLHPGAISPQSPSFAMAASDNAHDLKNYLWYHGNIPRQKAEVLVCKDGDFLVRDSVSQPNDYVLTVRWSGAPLHFVINRQIAGEDSGGNPKICYQFEENMFDRVAELVQFYIANKKHVSEMSGALMLYPINRTQAMEPKLSYGHASPFGLRMVQSLSGSKSAGHSPVVSPRMSPLNTPTHSPPAFRKHNRSGSQPLLAMEVDQDGGGLERRGSLPPMMMVNIDADGSASPSADISNENRGNVSERARVSSRQAPPKPALKKATRPVIPIRNRALYEDDGKDYTDYAQVKSWTSAQRRADDLEEDGENGSANADHQAGERVPDDASCSDYDVPRSNAPYIPPADSGQSNAYLYDVPKKLMSPARVNSKTNKLTLSLESQLSTDRSQPPVRVITSPNLDEESCFDYDVFSSGLIPKDNKPLDSGSIAAIKNLIHESNPKLLAQHLTYVDLEILKVTGQHDLGMGVFSGLELLTLPQGHRLRQDLIERHHSLRLFVTLTTVTCIKYPERARMLNQWIQVAMELKTTLGNLFGFSAVMSGLRSPQVTRLKNTWITLRQNHANSAFIYDAKLLPSMRTLDEGGSMLPLQNVTIPHVLPLVEMLERDAGSTSVLELWEESKADYGMEVLITHLDTARIITEQCGLYRVTSENALRDFLPDRDLEDLFRTELHLKVMWGARGASTIRQQRHSKFGQVLSVLSERVEPTQSSFDNETSL